MNFAFPLSPRALCSPQALSSDGKQFIISLVEQQQRGLKEMEESVVRPDEELVLALLEGENGQAWSFAPAVVELLGCPTAA